MSFEEYKKYFIDSLHHLDESEILDMVEYFRHNTAKTFYVIGNGGSAALASHFAQDMLKQCGYNITSLTDSVPVITAISNDISYDCVFVEQLKYRASCLNDCLIAISGSGGSSNILRAVRWANAHNIYTIGLSGYTQNPLSKMVDLSVCVDLNDMETVESIFSFICHYVVLSLKK